MCNGFEDKLLSAEVTGDIAAVGARISFNICGESRRGRGLLWLRATVSTMYVFLAPLSHYHHTVTMRRIKWHTCSDYHRGYGLTKGRHGL